MEVFSVQHDPGSQGYGKISLASPKSDSVREVVCVEGSEVSSELPFTPVDAD